MPDDLTVSRAGGPSPHPEASAAPRPVEPAAGAHNATGHPNPTMRLDPALGVVVVAFHDEHGAVTTTIPTQQQLDAYRTWERTHGQTPPHGSEV
jgi:hypothetical protein